MIELDNSLPLTMSCRFLSRVLRIDRGGGVLQLLLIKSSEQHDDIDNVIIIEN